MGNRTVTLREVDGAEIISIMDNTADFISTVKGKGVQKVRKWTRDRMGEEWVKSHFRLPFAEHGFSMLIRVFCNGKSHTILFDTGGSPEGVVTNARRMGLNLTEVEAIVLSHGHYDHFGGLLKTIRTINKKDLPVIVHEDMFRIRGVTNKDGTIRKYPEFPSENQVKPAIFVKTRQPYLLADNMMLVTGEIPRKTDFEKGYPQHRFLVGNEWKPDPLVQDDRAIVVNIKRKGLLVISGCAHAGIINTTLYSQQITGVNHVHAIMGGFHLAGKMCEPRIDRTVKELKLLKPELLISSHCTGWRGICAIAEALPQAFVMNSVGNLYEL
jgi:7,8-dihydropterin-6-yl-methyl-4-(beta-D-ribofuranosyl)aminobenzene 5'-phosphate synthase